MAIVIVKLVATFYSSASSFTNIATVTSAPTTGSHLLLIAGRGLDNATITGVADSVGNTWQVDKTAGGATVTTAGIGLASMHITNAMTTSTTITTTFSATGARKVVYIVEASGLAIANWFGSATALFEQTTNSTARGTSNSIAAATAGDLILGCYALPAVETGFTSTAPFTAWPTATGTGFFAGASAISVDANYLVTSDTSAKTPAATGARNSTYIGFAATYKQFAPPVPRTAAGFQNWQDPASWMKRVGIKTNWNRRRSGLLVPELPGLARPRLVLP